MVCSNPWLSSAASSRPDQIDPFTTGRKSLRVVIETPKGSRNKFAFDHEIGAYRLNAVLSEGMVFPYDFGFIPQTPQPRMAIPLDVLLLMDEPAFTGCVVESRIVGVIEGDQTDHEGKTVRNDRVLAVATKFARARRHQRTEGPEQHHAR